MGLDRSFLAMLNAVVGWESFTEEDGFGNDQWAAKVPIAAFVDALTQSFGAQDGQGKQDNTRIDRCSLVTDFKGIKVKDKITLPSLAVMHVSQAETGHDEHGQPLYQTITVVSTSRG